MTSHYSDPEIIALLVAHIICADEQLHHYEFEHLFALAEAYQISDAARQGLEMIVGDLPDAPALDALCRSLSQDMRVEAMRHLMSAVLIDGHYDQSEKDAIKHIAGMWSIPDNVLDNFKAEAERYVDTFTHSLEASADAPEELGFGARWLGRLDRVSPEIANSFAKVSPASIGQRITRLRHQILLAGPEYDEAIGLCARVARRDFREAHGALDTSWKAMLTISKDVEQMASQIGQQRSDESAKELIQRLQDTRANLNGDLRQQQQMLRRSLNARHRTMNQYTISFMGRTKAGKSTLHATVLGDGWDAIGKGSQRTTRYNRVYSWKSIRIIDTPGIGAPGGETDAAIARGVVDESDLICYIVSDDSVQESDFSFLKELKTYGKPITILLNVKANLSSDRRLQHFVENPERYMKLEGENSLQGHIDRIRSYALQFYTNDYFDVVPVQLYAAQRSREEDCPVDRDKLYELSRLPVFLDALKVSLVEDGVIRRSQTMLSTTSAQLGRIIDWLVEQERSYTVFGQTLNTKAGALQKALSQLESDTLQRLEHDIDSAFEQLEQSIPNFCAHAVEDRNPTKLWKKHLADNDIESRLAASTKATLNRYSSEIEDHLKELSTDLRIQFELPGFDFAVNEKDTKTWFRTGVRVLIGAAGIAALFAGGWVVPVVAFVGAGVDWLVGKFTDSKKEKVRAAIIEMEGEIRDQLREQKAKVRQEVLGAFRKQHRKVATGISAHFNALSSVLLALGDKFATARSVATEQRDAIDRAYAARVVAWVANTYEEEDPPSLNDLLSSLSNVQRSFGTSLEVSLTRPFPPDRRRAGRANKVLQEDLIINQPEF